MMGDVSTHALFRMNVTVLRIQPHLELFGNGYIHINKLCVDALFGSPKYIEDVTRCNQDFIEEGQHRYCSLI